MTNAQTSTSGLTRLRELSRGVQNLAGFDQAVRALQDNALVTVDGAWGSACALLAATLLKEHPPLLVVLCPHPREIDRQTADIISEIMKARDTVEIDCDWTRFRERLLRFGQHFQRPPISFV